MNGGREVLDRCGDRCAVAEPVDDVVVDATVLVEAGTVDHSPDVRMSGVDATVDDPDNKRPLLD